MDAADPEEGVRKLLAVVGERIPARFGLDPVRDVQVLCSTNRRILGVITGVDLDGGEFTIAFDGRWSAPSESLP